MPAIVIVYAGLTTAGKNCRKAFDFWGLRKTCQEDVDNGDESTAEKVSSGGAVCGLSAGMAVLRPAHLRALNARSYKVYLSY